MRRIAFRRTIGVLLAFALAVAVYGQGLYWESKTSGGPIGEQTSQHYYMPKMFKKVQGSNDAQVMIFRLDKEMIFMIKPKEKKYTEMTFAEIEVAMKKASAKTDDQMAKVRKQMESMPPEQRKMMEEQMGALMGAKEGKIEVKNTGEKKMISGFSSTKYVAKQGDKEIITLWTTKDVKDFEAMKKDFGQFMKRSMSMNPVMKGMSEAFLKIEGFSVQTEFGGMTNTVTKVERRSTPGSEFEVPAGYTKEKSDLFEEPGKDKLK